MISVYVRWSLHGIRYKRTYLSHLKASRTLEVRTNRLLRNVGNYEFTLRKVEDERRFIYVAAEARNHAR